MSMNKAQEFNEAPVDESEKSLPLMGGIVGPEGLPAASDIDAAPGPRKGISSGTLLILAVLVVAGGAISIMRSSQVGVSSAPAAQEVEARIEQALAKLAKPEAMQAGDPLARKNTDAIFRDTN